MTHNSNIPSSYKPAPIDAPNFTAPSHHLSAEQREQIVEVAEMSHSDPSRSTAGSQSSNAGSYQSINQSGSSSGQTGNYTSGLSGQSHSSGLNSQYNTRDTGIGSGTHHAAGLGANTGSSAGNVNVGSAIPHHGGNRDVYLDQQASGRSGYGNAGGAAAVGTAGAAGLGAAALGSHSGNTTTSHSGLMGQQGSTGSGGDSVTNKLQHELEQRAKQSGTHASGFGARGL